MRLAVLKETAPGERRVALVPESVKKLTGAGFVVTVERGAGVEASFSDEAYAAAGAVVGEEYARIIQEADKMLRVGVPRHGEEAPTAQSSGRWHGDEAPTAQSSGRWHGRDEIVPMRGGHMLLTSLMPTRNLEVVRRLAQRGVTSFSTDAIPRTTRAQSMDTLSAMASIAGYKGVLLAAAELGRYAPMLTTAAGTIFPAKFFVIGAGVAGLQAIATAKRLGAKVSATDVRPEVKEQIESVGAKYVGIELKKSAAAGGGYAAELTEEDRARQRELLAEQCAAADVVVTTALIGGVFAPKLITAEMVGRMRPGSVIMDLAAEGGGNCELSEPGRTVVVNGVTIMAPLNLASSMPIDASVLWSRNLTNFLLAFWRDKKFSLDMSDEIMAGAVITHGGEVVHARTKEAMAKA